MEMDYSDSDSNTDDFFDASSYHPHAELLEPPGAVNEVVVDLTRDRPPHDREEQARNENGLELTSNSPNGETSKPRAKPEVMITPRAYQLEMLEESLKRNLIVAMDTGSGKTHIAILRILHELDRISGSQFVWFLAPTVSLCAQQFEYIQSQITAVQVKFLSGNDGVDRWSDQSLWDTVLKNVKIVVSTYQILLDALNHGFVRLGSLGLIIFDEVHNCVGKNAGAKIMQTFYHTEKAEGKPVPGILALTASPVFRSNPNSLFEIEETMDSVAKTPMKYRSELRLQVKLPVLTQVHYTSVSPEATDAAYPRSFLSLRQEYNGLRISDDPYVKSLIQEGTDRSQRQLEKVRMNHKTWCHDQMKSLTSMSLKIFQQLGPWATDFYISEVVKRYTKMADDDETPDSIWNVSTAEKRYVSNALKRVEVNSAASTWPGTLPLVSDKAAKLIDVLLREPPSTFSGIIFVQERTMVSVLAQLLSAHPHTKDRFRIATMVGTSAHSYRDRSIGELIDLDSQTDTLSRFRSGDVNLVIATSVLEEGIDVPVCNTVICFQKPANLKSFVQRRGRARHRDSRLILLLDPQVDKVRDWEEAEQAMKRLYEDEMRVLREALIIEDAENSDDRQFRVETTGAILDMDNAVAHLHHFCSTLPAKEYVDLRPEFICSKSANSMIRAKVVLPLSVNEAVRVAESSTAWKGEKNAMRDAAFEAYVALYGAGLINDNLLPLMRHDEMIDELTTAVETRASIMTVNEVVNPWSEVAKEWTSARQTTGVINQCAVTTGDLNLTMYLPREIPPVPPLRTYWDSKTQLTITPGQRDSIKYSETAPMAIVETWSMLQAAFGHRYNVEKKQTILLFSANLEQPLNFQPGHQPVLPGSPCHGLVRDTLDRNIAYVFQEWLDHKPALESIQHSYAGYEIVPHNCPHLSLARLPKRLNFLHKIPSGNTTASSKTYSHVLPASRCTVDSFPFKYVQFAMLIPSIVRHYEIYMIAEHLSSTILKNVGITDLSLIVTAISTSSANEETNYQRLEFLGDSVLKLCTSVQLIAEYALWHEGYLSAKKDRLVANSRLARAAVEVGLDRYIITKAFTGHKWRPLFVEDLMQSNASENKRELSSKVLADVVEALIGASLMDGGIPKALGCLRIFLPELDWQPLSARQSLLYQRVPNIELPSTLQTVEALIGHTFSKKGLLIEALTHASYNSSSSSSSLERLEFLGDSILDFIIVSSMRKYAPDLTHIQMHLLRTALVNADFLAFTCMEWQILQESGDVVEVAKPTTDSATKGNERPPQNDYCRKTSTISLPLWRFLRHASPRLAAEQKETMKRHAELREGIREAMERGRKYPWAFLARLQAAKWYSDVIESVLGAVWVDAGGKWSVVEGVVERMGVLSYLRRIISEGVQVRHPKEEVGIWAGEKVVRYELRRGGGEEKAIERKVRSKIGEKNGQEYFCKLSVGDEEIVEVRDGVGREEVKTKAAEVAVEMFEKGEISLDEKMA